MSTYNWIPWGIEPPTNSDRAKAVLIVQSTQGHVFVFMVSTPVSTRDSIALTPEESMVYAASAPANATLPATFGTTWPVALTKANTTSKLRGAGDTVHGQNPTTSIEKIESHSFSQFTLDECALLFYSRGTCNFKIHVIS